MSPVVSFRHVSLRLGTKDILHDLRFDVEAGETLVLLGRSGSGKTTALKLVNALLHPSEGEVLVEGTPDAVRDDPRVIEAYLGKPREEVEAEVRSAVAGHNVIDRGEGS
jgi:ABC-type branched-subunit amino acid transport system ATPase component